MTDKESLIRRVVVRSSLGPCCWEWEGATTHDGYGRIRFRGKTRVIHRVVFETFFRKVAKGNDLDHLCRNRACWRPDHLEEVTKRVNWERSHAPSTLLAKRKACKNGHPFTEENTAYFYRRTKGKENVRRCRTCDRAASLRRWRKKRDEGNGQCGATS